MRKRQRKRPIAEINVVPYIDVMLVLLIIFMITAPLLIQGVNVQLPQASAKALPPKKETPMVISIDRQGKYFLNLAQQPTKSLSARELMTQVAAFLSLARQQHHEKPVYVKGDRDVDYGAIVHAMVLLQKAGAKQIGLITTRLTN
jgi:biopolymer transport protein TolR